MVCLFCSKKQIAYYVNYTYNPQTVYIECHVFRLNTIYVMFVTQSLLMYYMVFLLCSKKQIGHYIYRSHGQ